MNTRAGQIWPADRKLVTSEPGYVRAPSRSQQVTADSGSPVPTEYLNGNFVQAGSPERAPLTAQLGASRWALGSLVLGHTSGLTTSVVRFR